MLKTISNAFEVVNTTLGKITKVSRPIRKFILHILPLWLAMNCRMVFMNMQCWAGRSEKSYRSMFSKTFDWFSFNRALLQQYFRKEIIAVFDPTYIKKSGKKTYGLAKFWSGTAGKALSGLEVGCLCFVDVEAHSALHGIAIQSPTPASLNAKGKTLVDHYAGVVIDRAEDIKALTHYVVADGFFMKKDFIDALLKEGLHVITKARCDANVRYVYKGEQKARSRKRIYDGKIDVCHPDKKKLTLLGKDEEKTIYVGVVYCVTLRRKVLAAFVYYKKKKRGNNNKSNNKNKDKKKENRPEIIIATDIEMNATTMCLYYGLRFQVEFLIRDAKSYCGLEDCQARSKQKLHSHFNIALTAVSVAKAAYYLSLPKQQREGFSMADTKMMHMNELITERIFSNLNIDLSCKKYQKAYEDCLNFGRLRA